MLKGQFWGHLVVAAVPVLLVGLADPVGGRVLDWRNVLFVTTTPFLVAGVVALAKWLSQRPVHCYRCDGLCRFSNYHSECGRKRWRCSTCNELRTQSGGPG